MKRVTSILVFAVLSSFSSIAMDVILKNQSGETAYIKFTENPNGTNPVPASGVTPNQATINNNEEKKFALNSIAGGRMYVSFDKELSTDAPDGANPADTDYYTRFDKIEITYNATGGKTNLTAVDFYAIPMLLETSIQGTVIDHLTLSDNKSGNDVVAAIKKIITNDDPIVNSKFVRILSPAKDSGGYTGFDDYLKIVDGATLTISGTYFGNPAVNYNYTGTIGDKDITLTDGTHNIVIPMSTLQWDRTDEINHNGIYTCNGTYTVDGKTSKVDDNDIYSAVYRDLITGFNLGFIQSGNNNSSTWWGTQSKPFVNNFYNSYAKAISENYSGAYGFPFSDRYKHLLADLGGKIDALTITILNDGEIVPHYTPNGNVNPQNGDCNFNMIIVTSNDNFKGTPFTFNTKSFQGGHNYEFPTTDIGTADKTDAQVNNVPAQEGLNIYDFEILGQKHTILVKVQNGSVEWGSMSGGGDANWGAPNLFIGGL